MLFWRPVILAWPARSWWPRWTEAVEALVRAYRDRGYRLAIRITGDAADADEVVQDTLWTVSRRIDTFTSRGGCRLRLLALPDHRQCGLPEAAEAAEQEERNVVERPPSGLR